MPNGKITGIGPGIVLIIGIIFICILVESTTSNTVSIKEILNVNDFYITATEPISKKELISKYGQPEKEENWNYKKNENIGIPLVSLYYKNYEYIFKDNKLVRISIDDSFNYNTLDDVYKMFNLKKYSITQINNTGSSLRIYNTSVPDFWCQYDKKTIQSIRITFDTSIF